MNILLLGVDDYQANDVGRSDSQILVTIDTRHQKIKLTSSCAICTSTSRVRG